MHRSQELYNFLVENSWQLTEDWYSSVEDHDPNSVYSTKDPAIIKELKEQNQDYFVRLFKIFIQEEHYFFHEFKQWSEELAKDPKHLITPLHYVIREFMKTQEIVLNYIKKFISLNKETVELEKIFFWYDLVVKTVNLSMNVFIEEYHKNTSTLLNAQQETINELSSPVIMIKEDVALLPLVGHMDTGRTKFILENTLNLCAHKGIVHLFIDLSGVAIIDTMVAQQIFNLINALKLLGVKPTLSGIRPEIAQTATNLGLSFEDIDIKFSLAQALNSIQ
ncbi:STAS domain-containing protein [Bacillus taeanensis]|uniref:RsbT co-antagonist protein RsbRB n=1 Tax=Bacillus taeanensis TaxID=273032 RepID=A0A366XYA8_9BACI|nr:STAS domain-containing protein [Bacillus taeanensis]RBW71132.1 RsbT co-antagonist protein RsbRB [Bacillus taeanensis]